MLKIGAKNITGLYVGEEKITKAYLGADLVFSEKKPSRLPEGYAELEYISANGNQTILTSIFPTADIEIEVDISVDYSGDATIMRLLSSSRIVGSAYYLFAFQFTKSTSTMYGSANMGKNDGTTVKISNISTYKKMHVTYSTKEKSASIDEESIQFSSNEVYSKQKEFRLFGSSFSESNGEVGNAFYGKIYNFILKQGGAKNLNLVPCQNADGIAGFYNLVDGSFVGSQGSVPFIAGPAV